MKWCSGFYPQHSSVEGNQVNHEPVKNNKGLDSQGSSPPCMSSNPNSLQMLTMAKRLAWGILVHCTLLSTSHFVRQKSLAGPPRPTTILTCSELVNVSGCMQACWRGWKGCGGFDRPTVTKKLWGGLKDLKCIKWTDQERAEIWRFRGRLKK